MEASGRTTSDPETQMTFRILQRTLTQSLHCYRKLQHVFNIQQTEMTAECFQEWNQQKIQDLKESVNLRASVVLHQNHPPKYELFNVSNIILLYINSILWSNSIIN